MRWDDTETRKFLKLYLSHRCLWDPKHENYHEKFSRQEAYRHLIQDFKDSANIVLTEPEARSKVKTLRSTYYMELNKVVKHGRKPTLSWFVDFHSSFRNVVRKRYLLKPYPKGLWNEELWDPDKRDEISNEESNHHFEDTLEFEPVLPKEEAVESDEERRKPHKPVKTRKRKIKRHSLSTDSDYGVDLPSNESKEDEFDIYGKYIASQLRGMDLQRALRVQLQIQNIVSENRIEDAREKDM